MPLQIQTGGLTGLRRVRLASRRDRLRCRPHTLEPAARASYSRQEDPKLHQLRLREVRGRCQGPEPGKPPDSDGQVGCGGGPVRVPLGERPSYDAEMPIEIDGAIVEARRNDPVGSLPISDWCALLVPPE